ncbi:MAG: hypothetical protein A2V86_09200 [Deltaproteobacteria bacterium RBG_16_49_23]|nr:MAG: hypothetical protein A2V86_09200 [Deltaproteobacteria bacterium RBG_16_49_23]
MRKIIGSIDQAEMEEAERSRCKTKKGEKTMRKMIILGTLVACMAVLGVLPIYAAETVTVTGEIIETYCYALMGAKGESHRQCGIECVQKGIPAGLLEDGTNKVYVLLPNKDRSPLPKTVIDKMARKVTITGKTYATGGSQFLTIESIK